VAERASLRVPVCTLALVCAAALVSAAPAEWSAPLVLERQAVLAGELWRIVSGHLWHGEAALAVWDLSALALLGAWVEHRSRAELLAALGAGALLAGLAVVALRPDLDSYQGSSALASALLTTGCLHLLGRSGAGLARAAAALALLLLVAKLTLESLGLWPSLALGGSSGLESVGVAHLAGALAGGLVRCGFDLAARQSPETRTVSWL
jgi:membrane associated rhomboid family serine protease